MNAAEPEPPAPPPLPPTPPAVTHAPTPLAWRLGIAAAVLAVAAVAYATQHYVGVRGQAAAGVVCFFGLVAAFSTNLRAVNWRTIFWGVVLQLVLALLVLKVPLVTHAFEAAATVVRKFIDFSDKGAEFVFGNLAKPGDIALNPGAKFLFIFAFKRSEER